jgi:hypothetical protein
MTGTERRASRGGPLWILPPLALIVTLLLVYGRPPRKRPASPPPGVHQREETVAGFQGEALAGDGSTLHVRLLPLHADRERAEFDGRALEARLALARGTPWRLSLRWTPAPPASAETRRAPPAGLALDALAVADGQGTALVPIALDPAGLDPLRTLLAPPGTALLPGQGLDLVLWGRDPEAGARVVGLSPEVEAAADGPWCAAIELEPHSVRRDELEGPLARFDRGTPPRSGKSLDAPASDRPQPARY